MWGACQYVDLLLLCMLGCIKLYTKHIMELFFRLCFLYGIVMFMLTHVRMLIMDDAMRADYIQRSLPQVNRWYGSMSFFGFIGGYALFIERGSLEAFCWAWGITWIVRLIETWLKIWALFIKNEQNSRESES